ncbi:hypothetical protein FRB93_004736 [Tulasnella sp. JGI-2019a]|nr:hypothetical protein FRB93_004736 [Tulasnella sp. JGI-2019a]
MTLTPVPSTAPATFVSARQRADVVSSVKSAVKNLNLESASMFVSMWIASVEREIKEFDRILLNLGGVEAALSKEMEDHQDMVLRAVREMHDAEGNMNRDTQMLGDAIRGFEEAKAEVKRREDEAAPIQMFMWIPMIGMAQALADLDKMRHEADDAHRVATVGEQRVREERDALTKMVEQLRELQSESVKLNARMTDIRSHQKEVEQQRAQSSECPDYLGPIKANIDHCLLAVRATFDGIADYTIKDVAEGIKVVLAALKDEENFSGDLAQMIDASRAAEFKKQLGMIRRPTQNAAVPVCATPST